MPVHHGGKVGKAAKTLATKSSTHKAKSKAGKTLAIHKAEQHQSLGNTRPQFFEIEGEYFLRR